MYTQPPETSFQHNASYIYSTRKLFWKQLLSSVPTWYINLLWTDEIIFISFVQVGKTISNLEIRKLEWNYLCIILEFITVYYFKPVSSFLGYIKYSSSSSVANLRCWIESNLQNWMWRRKLNRISKSITADRVIKTAWDWNSHCEEIGVLFVIVIVWTHRKLCIEILSKIEHFIQL